MSTGNASSEPVRDFWHGTPRHIAMPDRRRNSALTCENTRSR